MERVEVYEDKTGEWRWRHIAGNNVDIVSESGEGYVNKSYAYEMAEKLNPNVPIGPDDIDDLPHDPPLNEMGC